MAMDRRKFLGAIGAAGAIAVSGMRVDASQPESQSGNQAPASTVPVSLTINGQQRHFDLDPRTSILDLLREQLDLTGTKKGCDHGQCGACTVLSNGRRINSCLSLAVAHDGEHITTIEGLAHGDQLHPMQEAFIEHDGFQCGYCTPGQICSAIAMLEESHRGDASFVTADLRHKASHLTPEEIRERMSGNICRCGAYPGIVSAVQAVANLKKGGTK
jgi:xanthine dehydrogenase YagT iron-sulfur-binding subunit